MNTKKPEIVNDIIHIVHNLGEMIFNIQSSSQLENVFGITSEQMHSVIKKIIDILPDQFLNKLHPPMLEEIKCICAREFIFFQVQEKWSDPNYQDDLDHFIRIFSRDIQQKINDYKNYKSIVRQEKHHGE